jgi:shikimate dehydrogenase
VKRFAVLGSPIEHSLSPTLHNFLFRKLDITAVYERFEVKRDELGSFLANHDSNEWQGFSLTMPLKEKGIRHCDSLTEEAIETGSINTLKRIEGGWNGYNTDVFGFRYLLERIPQVSSLRDKEGSVAILGAGGTARAALMALRDSGKEIKVFRRSRERDEALLRANPDIEILDWSEGSGAFRASILINCAPVDAMKSVIGSTTFKGFLLDSLYSPWPTPLMALAPSNYFSGKDLLVAQALCQYEIFCDAAIDHAASFAELRALI